MKTTRSQIILIAKRAMTETRVIMAMKCKHNVPLYQLQERNKPRGMAVSVTQRSQRRKAKTLRFSARTVCQ